MFVSIRSLMQTEDQVQYVQSQQQGENSNKELKRVASGSNLNYSAHTEDVISPPRPGMMRRRNSLTSLVMNVGTNKSSTEATDNINTTGESLPQETSAPAVPPPRPGMLRRRNSLTSLVMGVGNNTVSDVEKSPAQPEITSATTEDTTLHRPGMLRRRKSLTSLVMSAGKSFEAADATSKNCPSSSTNIASAMMMKLHSNKSQSKSLRNALLSSNTKRCQVDKQQWVADVQKMLHEEDPTTDSNSQQDDAAQELRKNIHVIDDTIEELESKNLPNRIVYLRNEINSASDTIRIVNELKDEESATQQRIEAVEDKMNALRQKIAAAKAKSKVSSFQYVLEKNRMEEKIGQSKRRQRQLQIMSKLRSRYGNELERDVKEILFDTHPTSFTPEENKEHLRQVLNKATKICENFEEECDDAKTLVPIQPNFITSLERTNQVMNTMVEEMREDFDCALRHTKEFQKDTEIENLKVLRKENEQHLSELRKELASAPQSVDTLVNIVIQSKEAANRQLPRLVRKSHLRDRQVQLLGKAISAYSDREKYLEEKINTLKGTSTTSAA